MLTTNELKGYAHMRRLRIVDHIWKDYLQDLALHILYRRTPNLVFRGGTCIWKVYRGDWFSEDLDLCAGSIPPGADEHVARELGFLGFQCGVERRKRTANMEFVKLSVTSPAHPRPITLQIEILASEDCPAKWRPATMYSPYPDVPPVEMRVPEAGDIASDKVSAIFDRDKPRDVHDLYILLKQGAKLDMAEVRRKVPEFTLSGFRKKMEEKRKDWKALEPLLVVRLPALEEEIRFIASCVGR
jgi:predicted nucleotidyltransferase component of viral defense system